jgi:hypothetical protein
LTLSTAALISGAKTAPKIIFNGAPLAKLESRMVEGKTVYVVAVRKAHGDVGAASPCRPWMGVSVGWDT